MQGIPMSKVAPRGCMPDMSISTEGGSWGASTAMVQVLTVSEDSFFFNSRTVSDEIFPVGISSSAIELALVLPLIVLAGEGTPLFLARDKGLFSADTLTFLTTIFFDGVTDVEETVDLTEAIDGDLFAPVGTVLFLADSGVLAATDGRFIFTDTDGVDGTLGRVMVTLSVDGLWVPMLAFEPAEVADSVLVLGVAEPGTSEFAVLNVVEPSLVVDKDEAGRDDISLGVVDGGRKDVREGVPFDLIEVTDGVCDLGLVLARDVLEALGVTLVTSILGTAGCCVVLAVVASLTSLTSLTILDRTEPVGLSPPELGENLESGLSRSTLLVGIVAVDTVLLATLLTEAPLEAKLA